MYLGPIVECKFEHVEKFFDTRACPNPNCKFYDKEKYVEFCETCGIKIENVSKPHMTSKVNIWDVSKLIDEKMYTYVHMKENSIDLWFCNRYHKGRSFNIDGQSFQIITPELIEEELKEFKENYQDCLDILKMAYGNYAIKWGYLYHSKYNFRRFTRIG